MDSAFKVHGIGLIGLLCVACGGQDESRQPDIVKPALSVSLVKPQWTQIPATLQANGSIAAWDEVAISSEISGLQLQSVQFEVGQVVSKGQLLASFDAAAVTADFQQALANLEQAKANSEEARLNADRARQSRDSLVMSAQQIARYLAEEKMALAKQASAQASLDTQRLRLSHTKVHAIDEGVITARAATIGGVYDSGQPLGRLIRQQRLEWRAEVDASEINQLQIGMPVRIRAAGLGELDGRIRSLSPALDPASRKALVYVDLPDAMAHGFRSGMFANGEFSYGAVDVWLLPQSAVLFKDGWHAVFFVEPVEGQMRVRQAKVEIGDIVADQIVIRSGLIPDQTLAASGVAFLSDGDTVKVVQP